MRFARSESKDDGVYMTADKLEEKIDPKSPEFEGKTVGEGAGEIGDPAEAAA